jgi:microcystin-dependent protein
MGDQYLAEIRAFPYNFAPAGWAFCDGQILPLSQFTALFSLLGTTYGGDGRSNFALPDLRGCVPIAPGQGPGLSPYSLGETGGDATVTLSPDQLPNHAHPLNVSVRNATARAPAGALFAVGVGVGIYQTAGPPSVQLDPRTLPPAGGGLPHNNLMPSLTLNFCIALRGAFPPRG